MSSTKSKRSQKFGSSRRNRHNRDAEVKENDKQLESADNDLYTVSEGQQATDSSLLHCDQPAEADINQLTSASEIPAHSQLKDCKDPSAQANVVSKKRKTGSTRRGNRRDFNVQEPPEEKPEWRLDVTEEVTEELEVTVDVSIKEEESKEQHDQAGDAIIENFDTKKETNAGPEEDFLVVSVQEYLHSDVMSENTEVDLTTNTDMLSVTDYPESVENDKTGNDNVEMQALGHTQNETQEQIFGSKGNFEEKQQQHTDVATDVVNSEGFKHELTDQAVTLNLMSQPQNAEVSLDFHDTVVTENKEIEIKDETEWCLDTDTSFVVLSNVHQTDQRQTEEVLVRSEEDYDQQDRSDSLLSESLKYESNSPYEHDQSKGAQSGQNYSINFSDPAAECEVPHHKNDDLSQVNNQAEQVDSLQDTLLNITNATPNENQEVRQDVQKCLNNLVFSATLSDFEESVLNSVPDQASFVIIEEDKQEKESTITSPSCSSDSKELNEATVPSISSLHENEQQCQNSSEILMVYSGKDEMSQEDSKNSFPLQNVITKAETGDMNISDHGLKHEEDNLKLNTNLACVEVKCAKENLSEVTEENKVFICSKQDEEVMDTTYLIQTVQPDVNISETPKQKDQREEGSIECFSSKLEPYCEPSDSDILHHREEQYHVSESRTNAGESGTEEDMDKIEEHLNQSDHEEEIKADVSEANDAMASTSELSPSTETSDFDRKTELIPAVSLHEEMEATDFLHDGSGEFPSKIKMQPNEEDFAHLQSGSQPLSDNEHNQDTRLYNEAPFHFNNTEDKDREKENNISDNRNLEIFEEQKPQENLCDQSALSTGEQENTEAVTGMSNEIDQITKSEIDVIERMNVNTEHKVMLVDDASHDLSEDPHNEELLQTDAIKSEDLQLITAEGLPQKNKHTQSFEEGVTFESYNEEESNKADKSLADEVNQEDRVLPHQGYSSQSYHGEAKDGNTSQTSEEEVVDCAEIITTSVTHSGHDLADVLHEESFSQTGKNLVASVSGLVTDIDFPSNTHRENVMVHRTETENVQDNEISTTLLGQFQGTASVTSEFVTTNTETLLTSVEPMETVEKDQVPEQDMRQDISVTSLQEEANTLIGTTRHKRKMGSTRKTRQKKNEDVDMNKGNKDVPLTDRSNALSTENCEVIEMKNEVNEEINTYDEFTTVGTAQQYMHPDVSSQTLELAVTNTDPSPVTEHVDHIDNDDREKRNTELDNDTKIKELGLKQKQQPCTENEEKELLNVKDAEEVKNDGIATDLLTEPEGSHDIPQTTEQKEIVEPKDETGECGRIDTTAAILSDIHQTDSLVWDEVTDAKGQTEFKEEYEKLEADDERDSKFTSVSDQSLVITEMQNDTFTDHTSMSPEEHSTSTINASASQNYDYPTFNLIEHNPETNASLAMPVNEQNVDAPDQNDNTLKDYPENLTTREQDSEQFKSPVGYTQESKPARDDEMTQHSGYSNSGNRRKFGSTRSRRGQNAGHVKEETLKVLIEKENTPEETEQSTAPSEVETLSISPETSYQSIERHSVESELMNVIESEKMDNSGPHEELADAVHLKQTMESDRNTILTPKQKDQEDHHRDELASCEARQLNDDISDSMTFISSDSASGYSNSGNRRKFGSTRSRRGQNAGHVMEETLELIMEKENTPEETEQSTAPSEVETLSISPETSYQSIERHSVESELMNVIESEKMGNSGPHEELAAAVHLKQTMESDRSTILLTKPKDQEDHHRDELASCEARQLNDEISAEESLTKNEECSKETFNKEEKYTTDNDAIESLASTQLLLPDVSLSKIEDSEIREQKNEDGDTHEKDLFMKKENYAVKLSSEDVTAVCSQQFVHSDLSFQTTELSLISNTGPEPVTDPIDDTREKMEKETAELHTQTETKKRKFGSKRKFQRRQQPNTEEEIKELKDVEGKEEVEDQKVDQEATPNLLTEPQICEPLAVCDSSLLNEEKEILESVGKYETEGCERIGTPPIMLSNVHQIDTVIPETKDSLFMPAYHIAVSERIHTEFEERDLETPSNKITEQEQIESPDVHPHESKSAHDNLITENPVTSGQRRKMGSTRKGLRGHIGGQKEVQEKENTQEQTIEEGNTSCKNGDGDESEKAQSEELKYKESRGAEDLTELIKTATNDGTVDTALHDTHSCWQIAETTAQDNKPQIHSKNTLLSEIVCELKKSNQPSILQISEPTSEQCKGTLQVPPPRSSATLTPPSSPGKKRKMGSSRKLSRKKPTEKVNNENSETELETENLDKYRESSTSTVINNVTEDVQGSVQPVVQAPCETYESSTTTTGHPPTQGKRKFGSKRAAKDSSGLGVHTRDDYEVDQDKTDVQRISDDLTVCDPFFISKPKSTAISHSSRFEEDNVPAVKATEAGLVSLQDIRKSSPPDESMKERPKIDFEQWNEQIPDFGLAVYNVVMVGNSNVGKTSFIKRLQSGNFTPNYSATIGVDTFVQTLTLGNRAVKLYIWDTAGQERYHSITRQVFHKAQGLLLMYDISSAQSFHAVRNWISQVQEKASADVIMMLLGNKNDCAKREVEQKEGEDLSKEYNIHFMECSAATGENVSESMKTLAWLLVKQRVRKEEDQTVLQPKPQQQKSGCC